MKEEKKLTTFKLVMMAVVAIDSLKNLPSNAQYGSHLIFYYILATLVFFIPSALVSAELATTWPATGGIYVWVDKAFGKRMAFLTVWLQWLIAMTWYPTILSFIAATLAYWFSPQLADNKIYIFILLQFLFWGATCLVANGLRISSLISTVSAIGGVILPMIVIMILGFYWLHAGHPAQIKLVSSFAKEDMLNEDSLRLFITLLYSLMGMEIIAAHAGDVKNPQKNYPRALLMAAVIILLTVIPSSLAIAIVIPQEKISLTASVVQAFIIFLHEMHLEWLKDLIILAIALGSFGIFLTWLLTASRCLLLAAQDGLLPKFLQKVNKHTMPVSLLLLQGMIFTLLSCVFVFMPSVNSAFWFMSAAAAQFALLYYIVLFAAAVRLRYKHAEVVRPFRVGKHPIILWLVCCLAIGACFSAFIFGFLPPPHINVQKYEIILSALIIFGLGVGGLSAYSAKKVNA